MYISELKKIYNNEIIKYFLIKLKYKNIMLVPKIKKVVINMGLGFKGTNKKYINNCYLELKNITMQKPLIIKTKKSISNFNIKRNSDIGLKVTLRNNNMYDFLYKLINISLPRIKDFVGLSKNSFDEYGNYNFSIKDHLIFPEIFLNKKITGVKGFNICINILNKNNNESYLLLKKMNFPFCNV
ncbi:50S ribosomal protein L5 [Candidatus Vidania fulgoroideorum]